MSYQWIVDGKIAAHFPQKAGNPNYDVSQIYYVPVGGTTADKQEIEYVYYLPSSANRYIAGLSTTAEQKAELDKYLVWHRYWGEVQNKKLIFDNNLEDNYVKIFELQNDATVNAIRIFANTATDAYSLTACLIDYNTGLTVGYGATETTSQTQETLYDVTGYYRTIALNSDVRLKALTKYYIGYLRPDNNKVFNNAYDEVTTGTVKTTGFTTLQQTVSDIYDKNYIGELTGTSCQRIDQVMSANNTILLCTSKPTDTPFEAERVYSRNTTYSARSWYGICDGQNYNNQGTRPVVSALKNMSAGQLGVANKLSWDSNDGYYLFERTNVEIPFTECTANITATTDQRILDLAHFIRDNLYWPSDESITARTFENQASIQKYWTWVSTLDAGIYTTNNTKYVIGNLDGLQNPPSSPIENGLYLKLGDWGGIGSWGNPDILQYKNGSWQNFDPATLFNKTSYEYTATFNEINNGWTAIGTSNTALMNASTATGKDGYFKLMKTDGTSIEV
jgi:hypothetical protein